MFEIHRRRRRLSQSITSSKLAPERDTSWMRGSLMERKGCNRKEEIRGKKGKCDGSSNAVYRNTSSGNGDILSVATQKKKKNEAVTNCTTERMAEYFERAQFVVSNKGHWCSTAWARCPMAG